MSPAKGQTKRFCSRGHNKDVVGRAPNGWCLLCREESYQRRGLAVKECPDPKKVRFRNEYCPAGHHKPTVGVDKTYVCLACKHERSRDRMAHRLYRKRRGSREAGLPDGMLVGRDTPLPKLRSLRLRAGLTQREMALRIGVSVGFYNRLETGSKKAGRVTLRNALDAVTEKAEGLPQGRYALLLRALVEAERREKPTAGEVAHILSESPLRVGSLLRWAASLGFAESFRGAPPKAEGRSTWLITDEGLALIEGRRS